LKSKFEDMPLDNVYSSLNSSKDGITENEATKRISLYGYNEVSEKKESNIIKFLKKFWNPVAWMLEITVVITFILKKYDDMYIILFLLIFNSIVGYTQESRANNALELLKKKLSVKAVVLRDRSWKVINSSLLVPGDVVHIKLGDVVPADAKIINGNVEVDQSALTGESLAVERKSPDLIYSSSIVRRGECDAIIVATGENTFFGKTAQLVRTAKAASHMENLIMRIVRYLIIVDVSLVIILAAYSILINISLSDVLPFILVILIASVPVALPATFTIAMAIGALEASETGALVTRLNAIEDAASMTTLYMDKTGTITKNILSVAEVIPVNDDENSILYYAAMASEESSDDPIDSAVLKYANDKNIKVDFSLRDGFTPFDPSTKMTSGHLTNGINVAKGAPQEICKLAGVDYSTIEEKVDKEAERGFRMLGVASGTSGKYRLSGLLAIYDAPREDSKQLISELYSMGITPRMVTGDNGPIAVEIAKEVGIKGDLCKNSTIKSENDILKCGIVAEVFPEDKYNIVKLTQKAGEITGMTGDGVNDAPALKQADVGIAVSTATDVAKASASIVLTHEGIEDIVKSVKIGRKIYQRMLTYTLNKIIKTMQVVIFLTLSFFVIKYFVTTPFDVILLLFANDFVTMSLATDNVRYSMHPEKWNVKSLVYSSISLAFAVILEGFIALYIGTYFHLTHSEMHTFIFDMLVFSGQFTVFAIRERKRFWNSMPSKYLLTASIADFLFISLISYYGILVTAIPAVFIVYDIILGFAFLFIMDTVKNMVFRRFGL
jgi:H+-transporting ATPase